MKECKTCGVSKELVEFYECNRMKDGHFNTCKECYCTYTKQRRIIRGRLKSESNYTNESLKDYRRRNPEKYRAHTIVGTAVRSGKITKEKQCSECSAICRLHAHHDDYTKPLNVRWLCARCHNKWHTENEPLFKQHKEDTNA